MKRKTKFADGFGEDELRKENSDGHPLNSAQNSSDGGILGSGQVQVQDCPSTGKDGRQALDKKRQGSPLSRITNPSDDFLWLVHAGIRLGDGGWQRIGGILTCNETRGSQEEEEGEVDHGGPLVVECLGEQ